jgi:hypothetical protein
MITILLAYIGFIIILVAASKKSSGILRGVFLSILSIIVIIPIGLILLITPAQRGKIWPAWGQASLIFFPPKDLFKPIAEAPLEKNKNQYNFIFSHNYVGYHYINIVFSNNHKIDIFKDKSDLIVTISVYDGKKEVFSKTASEISPFRGLNDSGFWYLSYLVPENLPIDKELNAKITVVGNIESFINEYGNAKIVIQKGSDE